MSYRLSQEKASHQHQSFLLWLPPLHLEMAMSSASDEESDFHQSTDNNVYNDSTKTVHMLYTMMVLRYAYLAGPEVI